MINNKIHQLFKDILSDSRLEKRVEKVANDMLTFGSVIVNRFARNTTDKIGAYRMLSNSVFTHNDLCKGLYREVSKQHYSHLLCIQDTSEINLTQHKELFEKDDPDIGQLTKKDNIGIYCHPMLVVDPIQTIPIGFSSIELFNRPWEQKNKHERNYKTLDIEDKESFRWISSVNQTKQVLANTQKITIIGDRESDIFEEMALVPDDRTDLLIRSTHNRRLYDNSTNLFDVLAQSPQKLVFPLLVKSNRKRENRNALIAVRYVKVKIKRPKKFNDAKYPKYVELWAIEAKELSDSTPKDEDPILWRLLTTHQVNSIEDAMTYIDWYKMRWFIEELFRVLKKQGLDIESSQLGTGAAIKKLTIIALHIALITMLLKLSMQSDEEHEAGMVFNPEQVKFLHLVNEEVQGKTLKQKNPYTTNTLAWAAWIIARLSGWSGYGSHGAAGYISLKRGLDVFNAKFDGYLIARKFFHKFVYKE
jgi:hypothetical protein